MCLRRKERWCFYSTDCRRPTQTRTVPPVMVAPKNVVRGRRACVVRTASTRYANRFIIHSSIKTTKHYALNRSVWRERGCGGGVGQGGKPLDRQTHFICNNVQYSGPKHNKKQNRTRRASLGGVEVDRECVPFDPTNESVEACKLPVPLLKVPLLCPCGALIPSPLLLPEKQSIDDPRAPQ